MNDTVTIPNEPAGFLRLPQVLKLIPVSKATWWNGCRTGRFPAPYKLAPRVTAWKASDIHQCMSAFQLSSKRTNRRSG